jgi:hypothetical protein
MIIFLKTPPHPPRSRWLAQCGTASVQWLRGLKGQNSLMPARASGGRILGTNCYALKNPLEAGFRAVFKKKQRYF